MKENRSIVLTLILFLFLSISASGQVYKLKSSSFSSKYKINDYKWSDWSEWEETSVLITMDIDKERITIYSKETQVYDVAENEGETIDDDGDKTLSFFCVDKEGLTCRVRLMRLNSQNGRNQLYVDYKDLKWVYNVYLLD